MRRNSTTISTFSPTPLISTNSERQIPTTTRHAPITPFLLSPPRARYHLEPSAMKHQHQLAKQHPYTASAPSVTGDDRRVTTSTPRLEHSNRLSSSISHSIRRQAAPSSVADNDHRAIKASIGAKFQNDPQGAIFRGGYSLRAKFSK